MRLQSSLPALFSTSLLLAASAAPARPPPTYIAGVAATATIGVTASTATSTAVPGSDSAERLADILMLIPGEDVGALVPVSDAIRSSLPAMPTSALQPAHQYVISKASDNSLDSPPKGTLELMHRGS